MKHENKIPPPKGVSVIDIEEYGYKIQQQEHQETLTREDAIKKAMQLLEQERPTNLANIKESCVHLLQRFMNSKGVVHNSEVHLPLMEKSNQNADLTKKQIKIAHDLMKHIDTANSMEEVNEAIEKTAPVVFQGNGLGDSLGAVIGQCLIIMESVKGNINKY